MIEKEWQEGTLPVQSRLCVCCGTLLKSVAEMRLVKTEDISVHNSELENVEISDSAVLLSVTN
jgi:hypothetical protein